MGDTRSGRGRPRKEVLPAMGVPEGVKVVLAGIDTLWLSVKGALEEPMVAELDRLKELAQMAQESVPSPWSFSGQKLYVEPYGAGKGFWRWVLRCDALMLDVGVGEYAPICRAQVASEYLWQMGAADAISSVDDFLRQLFGAQVHISPSEVHLCVDVAGLTPGMLLESGLVGRSRRRVKELPEEGEEAMSAPGEKRSSGAARHRAMPSRGGDRRAVRSTTSYWRSGRRAAKSGSSICGEKVAGTGRRQSPASSSAPSGSFCGPSAWSMARS